MDLRTRAEQIKAWTAELPGRIRQAQRDATLRAVERATEMTTPENGILRGANMVTGEMAQHWATDSVTEPRESGGVYETALKNNVPYAAYVNDGHRLDRHFVPGLYVDGAGMLSRNPDGRGGLIVGTKTTWVEGVHMTDYAADEYRKVLHSELDGLVKLIDEV